MTRQGNSKGHATKLSWWQILIALICLAGGGVYLKEDKAPQVAEQTAPQVVEQKTQVIAEQPPPVQKESKPQYTIHRWNQNNLQRHWEKHQAEFPEFHSAEEYGDAALQFFRNPPEQTLVKTRTDGDRVYYHPPSNNFGAVSSDGYPKTFFRPDRGRQYWEKQQ